MSSKKVILIVGMIFLIFANIIVLSFTARQHQPSLGFADMSVNIIAPFQEIFSSSFCFIKDIWRHYFFLISVSKENAELRAALSRALEKNNQCKELELSNLRLRKFLNLKKNVANNVAAAEVIGKDPSSWFKTILIDKGASDGVKKGFPVVVPEGIAGQVVDVAYHYSKVLLVIDQNSSVDAIVQRTRSRGIIKGNPTGQCSFEYVLRKHDVRVGDTVVASGLDGVFPKGLRIGRVSGIVKRNAGIFQEITVTPFVDFEKIEEVFVVLNLTTVTDEKAK